MSTQSDLMQHCLPVTNCLHLCCAQTSLLIEIQRYPEARIMAVMSAMSANVCVGSLILIHRLIDVIGDYPQNVSKQQLMNTEVYFHLLQIYYYD